MDSNNEWMYKYVLNPPFSIYYFNKNKLNIIIICIINIELRKTSESKWNVFSLKKNNTHNTFIYK